MPSGLLVTSLVNTIQIGSLYALMALGITLTFSVMKLPNFAHADYFTAGGYAALIISLAGVLDPIAIMAYRVSWSARWPLSSVTGWSSNRWRSGRYRYTR